MTNQHYMEFFGRFYIPYTHDQILFSGFLIDNKIISVYDDRIDIESHDIYDNIKLWGKRYYPVYQSPLKTKLGKSLY